MNNEKRATRVDLLETVSLRILSEPAVPVQSSVLKSGMRMARRSEMQLAIRRERMQNIKRREKK